MVEFSGTAHRGRAFAYFRDCLAQGKSLVQNVLQQADLSSGTLGTLIFDDGVGDVIEGYEYGPSPPEVGDEVDLSNYIFDYVEVGGGRVVIIEDACARPSDPCMAEYLQEIMTFGDEVYHIVSEEDLDTDRIELLVRRASSPHLEIGVMTSVPSQRFPPARRRLTTDHLKMLARGVERIFVGAYDGEGYLVWSKE